MGQDAAEKLLAALGQTHIAAVTLTSAQVTTTNAIDLPTAEALANANKVAVNAVQADLVAVNTALTSLLTELQTAGVLKSS